MEDMLFVTELTLFRELIGVGVVTDLIDSLVGFFKLISSVLLIIFVVVVLTGIVDCSLAGWNTFVLISDVDLFVCSFFVFCWSSLMKKN